VNCGSRKSACFNSNGVCVPCVMCVYVCVYVCMYVCVCVCVLYMCVCVRV